MRDPRAYNLARILVRYSTKVQEGEVVSIDGESAAEPLLAAIYEEVLKAGAHPMVNMSLEGQAAAYYKDRKSTIFTSVLYCSMHY